MQQPDFLPVSKEEMRQLGWEEPDVLLVSGDAYVDHPSFGIAILGRLLVSFGLRVGIIAQPRWENPDDALQDLAALGRPKLFAGVSAGALDSMLAHYTAFRKKRSDDAYTPGGKAGARPNRAAIVYTGLLRRAFPGIPVVLGGIEASLRRASHYDFWTDALRRSILLDSKADILVYGMGENPLASIAERAVRLHNESTLDRKTLAEACADVPGTALAWSALPRHDILLPSHEEIAANPSLLMKATLLMERQVHHGQDILAQASANRYITLNPPPPLAGEMDMDKIYNLPFSRLPHPSYDKPIPAWEMIRTSITTHRGCGGGCSFCSLALHQGRRISSRSGQSILKEARFISKGAWLDRGIKAPRWAGSISDVGGPSANMWQANCTLPDGRECERESCLHPSSCQHFKVDQSAGVKLLREVSKLDGVNHVRIASGVRFDLALKDKEALAAYTSEFTGGQLKVAPEHSDEQVLRLMRKPPLKVFEEFLEEFSRQTGKSGKELYTVPYLISAFPGCTEDNMHTLAAWLRKKNWKPQQVQCFIPTPGTVATAMFYAGIDPKGSPLRVARTDKERMRQHYILTGEGNPPPKGREATSKPATAETRKRFKSGRRS